MNPQRNPCRFFFFNIEGISYDFSKKISEENSEQISGSLFVGIPERDF